MKNFLFSSLSGFWIPLTLFLGAYAAFAIIILTENERQNLFTEYLVLALVGIMIISVLLQSKKEDEVRRAILDKSYRTGYWCTFLFLIASSLIPEFLTDVQSYIPIWSVPVISFLAGYLIVNISYR